MESIKTDTKSILASLRLEGLEPDEETMAVIEKFKRGEITTTEAIEAGKLKYTSLAQGKYITFDEALKIVKAGVNKLTKHFHELTGKEMEKIFQEGTKNMIKEIHNAGQPTAHGDDKGVYLLYPDGRKEYVELYEDETT